MRPLDRLHAKQGGIGALLPKVVQIFDDGVGVIGVARVRPLSLFGQFVPAEVDEMARIPRGTARSLVLFEHDDIVSIHCQANGRRHAAAARTDDDHISFSVP